MGADWRQKHYTLNGTLKIAPYMRRIMDDYKENEHDSIRIPDADIKTFSLLFADYIYSLNRCVVIIASGKEITEYIRFVKDAGLYNDDPELAQIVFTSYNIQSHYAYCKKIFDKKAHEVRFPKKIVITTFSYIGKTLRGANTHKKVFAIFNELYVSRESYDLISIANEYGDYDIKTVVLAESIRPILNVGHAIGFTNDNVSDSISGHINKHGETYILSFNGYTEIFDGYENVIICNKNDDPSIDAMMGASQSDLMDATEQPKLYWRTKHFKKIVPINSIICIIDSLTEKKMCKILNKTSKYSRTLTITFIYKEIYNYVFNTVINMIDKEVSCKSSAALEEAYKMLAMIGVDLFTLNKVEQFIVCYYIKPKHTVEVIELWRQQGDNKLSEDGIVRYLSIYL
jgi:hypothetical protein